MTPNPTSPPFQFEAALQGAAGDHQLLAELAGILRNQLPAAQAGLRQAVQARDAAELRREGHRLGGALGLFRAGPSLRLIRQIEAAGDSADWEQADLLLTRLAAEFDRLLAALALTDGTVSSSIP